MTSVSTTGRFTQPEVALTRNSPIGGIIATPADKRTPAQNELLQEHYFATVDKPYQKLAAAHSKLAKQETDMLANPVTSMIMTDNPENKMRMTYILDREASTIPLKRMRPSNLEFPPPCHPFRKMLRLIDSDWPNG